VKRKKNDMNTTEGSKGFHKQSKERRYQKHKGGGEKKDKYKEGKKKTGELHEVWQLALTRYSGGSQSELLYLGKKRHEFKKTENGIAMGGGARTATARLESCQNIRKA